MVLKKNIILFCSKFKSERNTVQSSRKMHVGVLATLRCPSLLRKTGILCTLVSYFKNLAIYVVVG